MLTPPFQPANVRQGDSQGFSNPWTHVPNIIPTL